MQILQGVANNLAMTMLKHWMIIWLMVVIIEVVSLYY
jgi:hypothetical protein